MADRLEGKVAIVTGAGHGIGAAIARRFAAEGARVLLADRDGERVAAVAAQIAASGGIGQPFVGDVSATADVRAMIDTALERFSSRLDILVNNAALTSFGRSIDSEDMEARYDALMATNVKSVWMALHYAVPHLRARRESGGSSVIQIASVHGLASSAVNSAYAASKAALLGGARALAVELAPDRIRVNCISPGLIDSRDPSERTEWLRKGLNEEQLREFETRFGDIAATRNAIHQPLPIAGLPDDIAHAAVYLASDESRFCTGANLVIDGGATAALPNPSWISPEATAFREREAAMHEWLRQNQKG